MVEFIKATFPDVPLMFMLVVVKSGVGKAAPIVPPANFNRKYFPAPMVPLKAAELQLIPVDDAYCTLQPLRFTGLALRL